MSLTNRIRSLWRAVVDRERAERELDDELRATIEMLVEEKLAAGMSGRQARRAAMMELGGVDAVKERVRDVRPGAFGDAVMRDVRYAVRALARGGQFTVVVVATLALGIGANSAVFSLVNGLLLRPLPWPDVDRLVWIATPMVTSDNLGEWRQGMRSVERVAGFGLRSAVLTGRGPAERVSGTIVTEDFLPLLGARPIHGRLWTVEEQLAGGAATVVVSQRLWDRLGGGRDAGASSVLLDGESFTIIGVLPAEFDNLHYESDIWYWYRAAGGIGRRLNIIALRRPGVALSDVQEEATSLAKRVELPAATERSRFANIQTLPQIYTGDIRAPLLILFAAAGFVLLIACANVANLLLSRAAGREREMAVRTALGASRIAILRQLLVESSVLALCGGIAGWFVASLGLRAVLSIVPEHYAFGRVAGVSMDETVLAFTFVIAAATTLMAGLAPALHIARHAVRTAAGAGRASATRRTRRSRETLVAGEIGLALVLVIGTLLLIRTFFVLRPVSPGFEVEDRMIASLRLPSSPLRDDAGTADFARRLLRGLEAASPLARIALATDVPLSGSVMRFDVVEVDGRPVTSDQRMPIDLVSATPNYFEVVGMQLTRGRGLAAMAAAGSSPVAVVNESAARRFWPDADPIGRQFTFDIGPDRRVAFTVIGIAADTRSSGINTRSFATAFVSFWQLPWPAFEIVVHQSRAGMLTAEDVRRVVASIDAGVPVGSVRMMEQLTARAVAEPRYHMILMMVFGGLAVVLAMVGCYGVLSYSVAQRTREIGVRVALGATRGVIVRSVVMRGAMLVLLGLMIGTALAFALTRVLESSLYGVTPTDPAAFALAAAGLAAVSLIATYLPARRAAAVQPAEALRSE